jgi:hypothetical protein
MKIVYRFGRMPVIDRNLDRSALQAGLSSCRSHLVDNLFESYLWTTK